MLQTTSAAAMARGWQCHQAGDLDQAERIYRAVLQTEPGHADAWYLLGVVCQSLGRVDEALTCYQRALASKPDYPDVHNNLGVIYSAQGNLAGAIASYREAIRCKPGYPEAYNNLGLDLAQLGRLDEAVASYREAVRLRPSYAEAYENLRRAKAARSAQTGAGQQDPAARPNAAMEYNNQGAAFWRQGRLDDAMQRFQEALRCWPGYADAYHNLGLVLADRDRLDDAVACYQQAARFRPDCYEAYNSLGNAHGRMGRLEDAAACYRRALQLRPDYAAAHNNLAVVLEKQHQLDDAVAHYREALRLTPDLAPAHNNLGVAYDRQGKLDDAEACYRRALQLQPEFADAHNNLGNVFRERLQFVDAEQCFRRAVQIRPDYADAHLNHAMVALLHADFTSGWPEYEWRLRRSEVTPRTFRAPGWDGSPLHGRAILLHAEQGLGDTLQFIRYAPLVKERGGQVIVECQPALLDVLATCPGIDLLLASGQPLPAFDVQAPLLSLPGLFGTTLASLPADVPYLSADSARLAHWRRELSRFQGFKIGIVWQGSLVHRGDRQRSVPLTQFASLGRLEGVHLFSLQVGPGCEQLTALGDRFPITDIGIRFDPASFADAAAAVKSLDLVISVDTALAHLAGALAVPVWIALPFSPDWRWLLHREDSPWYPTLRLFRQRRLGDWEDVFDRLTEAVRQVARADME
jgi:tetratricopeptide (TPR) repeat protein